MTSPVFLYLDDEVYDPSMHRSPEVFYVSINAKNVLDEMAHYDVVKFVNVPDAIDYIKAKGCPAFISFDNDLGEVLEGIDLAKWLVESDLEAPGFIPADFKFFVHSRNNIASDRIYSLLNSYMKSRTMVN